MPTHPSNPPEEFVPQPDEGTNQVLEQHYPPPRGPDQEADQFRARLQAAVEPYRLQINRLPGHLLVPQYDIVLIGDRASDLERMEMVRQMLRENIRLSGDIAPRILLNEPLAGESSSYLSWLRAANRISTFVFIYVTNSFLENPERLQYIENLYHESVSGPPERRNRIVPVLAPDVDRARLEDLSRVETALFLNIRGLEGLEWDAATGRPHLRDRDRADLTRMLNARLGQRMEREDQQVRRVSEAAARATRQEFTHLLQQMQDFLTQRMGMRPEDVKAGLAAFCSRLALEGEPAPLADATNQGTLLQEVGSLQTPHDSAVPTMASASAQSGSQAQRQPQQLQQVQQQPQRPAAASIAAAVAASVGSAIDGVQTLSVASSNQLSVTGLTVHVHVTYVPQFVAGATQAHQHVTPGDAPSGAGVGDGGAVGGHE